MDARQTGPRRSLEAAATVIGHVIAKRDFVMPEVGLIAEAGQVGRLVSRCGCGLLVVDFGSGRQVSVRPSDVVVAGWEFRIVLREMHAPS